MRASFACARLVCCRIPHGHSAALKPLSKPGWAFCVQLVLFAQKNCDFESRANTVIATTTAGGGIAVIGMAESFVAWRLHTTDPRATGPLRGAGAADGPERLRHQAGRACGTSKETLKAPQPELLLAGFRRYGTWLASGVTGLSLAMSVVGVEGAHVVAAGVALFIGLPVLRVLVMLGEFILNQDYRLVIAATVVLMTILAGLVIGLSLSNPLAL